MNEWKDEVVKVRVGIFTIIDMMMMLINMMIEMNKGLLVHCLVFLLFLDRETTFVPLCFHGQQNPSSKVSALKEKNLLLKEQILSFKS